MFKKISKKILKQMDPGNLLYNIIISKNLKINGKMF